MPIEYIDLVTMEKMCRHFALEFFDASDDPIPPFSEHTPALLESALNLPKASFDGKELYPTLVDKAAILYYTLVKNHAFPNGNKRLATAALLLFFYLNNQWLQVPPEEMAAKTIAVAASKPQDRDDLLQELKNWISQHIVAV